MRTIQRLGQVATTAALRAHGMTSREISAAVSAGELVRIRRGLYVSSDAPALVRHAAEHGGVPGCADAARQLGLWVLQTPCHCVWLGRAAKAHPGCTACRLHWTDGTVVFGHPPPVEIVLLQLAECGDEETFFAAYESALRLMLISPAAIAWLRRRMPTDSRWLMDIARSDADSGLESLVRLRMHLLGIPVRTQVRVRGVGEVDILIGDRLLIECDGRENHAREAERHKDLLRDAAAAARGYETLRFDYAMIVHDWPHVEAAILARLADGAHRRRA
ncbi:type IV toxin-antitoxin system AbiEi family antitoxin domain-containing protein [Microbacterium soli]